MDASEPNAFPPPSELLSASSGAVCTGAAVLLACPCGSWILPDAKDWKRWSCLADRPWTNHTWVPPDQFYGDFRNHRFLPEQLDGSASFPCSNTADEPTSRWLPTVPSPCIWRGHDSWSRGSDSSYCIRSSLSWSLQLFTSNIIPHLVNLLILLYFVSIYLA